MTTHQFAPPPLDSQHTVPALDGIAIRPAHPTEVNAMLALFEGEVRAGKMLPRHPLTIRKNIGDWLVAIQADRVVGCVSLVFYNGTLCEIRSLAVDPASRGNGLGSALVKAALELARQRGAPRVLALTRAVPLFEKLGFRRDLIVNYPEKVWHDCAPCPFKEQCDEVALIIDLEPPSGHNGNGRRSQ